MRHVNLIVACALVAGLSACGEKKFTSYSGPPVTQVVVHKSERKMYLVHEKEVLKEYDIELGGNPVGPKQFEGDGKTPEGGYYITHRNPRSQYYLSLGISYPNDQDKAIAEAAGKEPGGDIFIHGLGRANPKKVGDWTAGCIAVSNKEMREVYAMVTPRTPIFIDP